MVGEPSASDPQPPMPSNPIAGTIAQALGGAVASFIATTLGSFEIYMRAGWESSFGTLLGILGYLFWHKLRSRGVSQ